MRGITYRARYMKGGKEVFSAVMFAGNVGVYTAMKAGGYSISENQRWPEKNPLGLFQNLFMMFAGYNEISWIIRDTLMACNDYDCAYKRLAHGNINALGYIILAGTEPGQGAIISRNRFGAAHVDKLDASKGKWYVV